MSNHTYFFRYFIKYFNSSPPSPLPLIESLLHNTVFGSNPNVAGLWCVSFINFSITFQLSYGSNEISLLENSSDGDDKNLGQGTSLSSTGWSWTSVSTLTPPILLLSNPLSTRRDVGVRQAESDTLGPVQYDRPDFFLVWVYLQRLQERLGLE